jgi:hypothetical protein
MPLYWLTGSSPVGHEAPRTRSASWPGVSPEEGDVSRRRRSVPLWRLHSEPSSTSTTPRSNSCGNMGLRSYAHRHRVGPYTRFKVCIFPKVGDVKGPRDELDISAATPRYLLLVEAKPKLTDSLSRLNRAGESDWDKLLRLMSIDEEYFLTRLSRAYGTATDRSPSASVSRVPPARHRAPDGRSRDCGRGPQ